jgi:uncharacterized membrane protein YdcZ (DUF606 family)
VPIFHFAGMLHSSRRLFWFLLCGMPPTATVTALTALAPGLGRAGAVMGEVAGTALSSDMAGARRLLSVNREIAAIEGARLVRHGVCLSC